MIGFIVLAVLIGIIIGLALAAFLDRATAKAPATNVTHGISAIGLSPDGKIGLDPYYARMMEPILERMGKGL